MKIYIDFDGTLFDSMPLWKGLKFEFFDKDFNQIRPIAFKITQSHF